MRLRGADEQIILQRNQSKVSLKFLGTAAFNAIIGNPLCLVLTNRKKLAKVKGSAINQIKIDNNCGTLEMGTISVTRRKMVTGELSISVALVKIQVKIA